MKKTMIIRRGGLGTLVFMSLAALLAGGCSKQQSETPAAAASGDEAVEKTAITDAVLNQLGLQKSGNTYRFKETKKISVEIFDRGLDGGRSKPEDNFYTNWIKAGMLRDHNVEVTFVPVGRWAEIDELNNLLAAGTAPDICVTYDYATIQAYANMGGVSDLNPYINKYVDLFPSIWGWLEDEFINYDRDPQTHQLWALEARLSSNADQNVYVRSDWLKKLNIAEPKTLDEFYKMLCAFRDNAQVLLGKEANMMTPFIMGQDVAWQTKNLVESFIPTSTTDRDWFIYGFDDRHLGRPSTVRGEIAIKSAMRVLNKWYNEGLIWKDFALYGSGDTTQDNLTKSGYVGAFMQNWDVPYRDGKNSITNVMHANVGPDANFVAVAPFPNDKGAPWHVSGPRVDRKVFLPASNKEPVASLLYLDWLHNAENLFYVQFGDKGVTHEVESNGAVRGISTTGEKIMNSPNNIDYTTLINGVKMSTPDLTVKTFVLRYSDTDIDPSIIESAFNLASSPITIFGRANVGPVTSEEGMGQVLSDKRDAIYAKAVPAPSAQFDAVFDAGYKDWLASGGQAIMDERAAKWKQFYGDKTSVD